MVREIVWLPDSVIATPVGAKPPYLKSAHSVVPCSRGWMNEKMTKRRRCMALMGWALENQSISLYEYQSNTFTVFNYTDYLIDHLRKTLHWNVRGPWMCTTFWSQNYLRNTFCGREAIARSEESGSFSNGERLLKAFSKGEEWIAGKPEINPRQNTSSDSLFAPAPERTPSLPPHIFALFLWYPRENVKRGELLLFMQCSPLISIRHISPVFRLFIIVGCDTEICLLITWQQQFFVRCESKNQI